MNFYLYNGKEKYHVQEVKDGMAITYDFLDYLIKNGTFKYGDLAIIGSIDPFDSAVIIENLNGFKSDVKLLYSKASKSNIKLLYIKAVIKFLIIKTLKSTREFYKYKSLLQEIKELPDLISLIDYAINHNLKIISIGD